MYLTFCMNTCEGGLFVGPLARFAVRCTSFSPAGSTASKLGPTDSGNRRFNIKVRAQLFEVSLS